MNNRNKFILSIIGIIGSVALLVTTTILAENTLVSATTAVALTIISVVLVLCATFFATKIDYETGVYECRNCGHIFKPTFKSYILGMHTTRSRYLECPECGKTTWCKRKTAE